jgi:hypothetical protein
MRIITWEPGAERIVMLLEHWAKALAALVDTCHPSCARVRERPFTLELLTAWLLSAHKIIQGVLAYLAARESHICVSVDRIKPFAETAFLGVFQVFLGAREKDQLVNELRALGNVVNEEQQIAILARQVTPVAGRA